MLSLAIGGLLAAGIFLGGCGNKSAQVQQQATQVKAMYAIQQNTPLSSDYAGQIKGLQEVKVLPRVSGTIMEKYVEGGQFVREGQPLYKIDSRKYESAVLTAQANLAQSEATLNNAIIDLQRDESLLASAAIAEQTVTTQRAQVRQYQALVDANAALLKKAQEDLDDTVVYSPMDGRVDVNDVSVGTYANAGQTVLMTVGSVDPVYVQFSISETEYLKFLHLHELNSGSADNAIVTITLSDGREYPLSGKLVQADRALSEGTGTLAVKALFPNPRGILLPGMFARVKLSGETVPNAILVPQRAIQQVLDAAFVIVVGEAGKSKVAPVTLGEKVGSYYIITKGVSAGDNVVVEGLTKLQAGMDLSVTEVTGDQMGFTFSNETEKATMGSADTNSATSSSLGGTAK